jgi:hypothetical protein
MIPILFYFRESQGIMMGTSIPFIAIENNTRIIDNRQQENGASQPAVYVQKSTGGSAWVVLST